MLKTLEQIETCDQAIRERRLFGLRATVNTEGFDTTDLREAKALLDELS